MKTRLILLVCVVTFAIGCGEGQPRRTQWETLDLETTVDKIKSPTGTIDEATLRPILERVVQDKLLDATRVAGQRLRPVLPQATQTSGLRTAQSPLQIKGAHAWFEVSCPGEDTASPDTSFASGKVRIDAPNIDSKTIGAGDVLLSFVDCAIGQTLLDGDSPAFYSVPEGGLITSLALNAVVEGEPVSTLRADALFSARRIAVVVELPQFGTFRLELDGLPQEVTVVGASQTFVCQLQENQAQCSPAGSDVSFTVPLTRTNQ